MVRINTAKCASCDKKLFPHKINLTCDLCYLPYHSKCTKLTKSEALNIITSHFSWTCYKCVSDILPIGIIPPTNNNITLSQKGTCTIESGINKPCNVCNKAIGKLSKECSWCSNTCHSKCITGELGCKTCATDIIPGFQCYAWELNHSNKAMNIKILSATMKI